MIDPAGQLAAALADRYRIEGELGQGGMATVYLAHDLKHDRPVAIKVLRPELAAALGAERFLSEIRITARLDHPHILTLIDSGDANGLLFYVMPLVRGESLRARITRERQIGLEEALRISRQVASALDYAHRQGVIHRDIKPENILLHEEEAILTDFGIALAVREAGGERLTATGLSIGTPSYMSPEQAAGDRDVDARSDIYSLGAVTYEMLAGEPPVTGASAHAVIAKLMTERPTDLRVLRPTVPVAVEVAVMRALEKVRADRYATAHEFAGALASAVAAGGAARTRRANRLGRAAFVLLLIAGGVYLSRRFAATRQGGADAIIRSIAVLPLDNYSADSTQIYFAEGMTDELTTDLATISALRVTSRGSTTQFAGRNRPPTPDIAKALNVDAIVEGSVTRSGNRVRITAQLIDARADRHIWGQSFERQSSDVLALQAELASAIAQAINAQLTPSEQARLAAAPSIDPAAHEAYLKGRYFFNRGDDESMRRAIEQFDEAIRLSPGFAPAYAGLSDAYQYAAFNGMLVTATEAGPKVKAAAETAVRLDGRSAEALTSLAVYKAWYEHDWTGSERDLRRAVALGPSYAYAHDQLGLVLAFTGRFDEAFAEGRRAVALDPLSYSILADVFGPLAVQRKVAPARELMRKMEELDPDVFYGQMQAAWLDLELGKYRDAIPKIERARTMHAPPWAAALLGYAHGMSGDSARALGTLEELKQISPAHRVAPYNLALVYLGLGARQRALDYLEQAYDDDSQFLVWLKVDHLYDPLRAEPRFIELLRKMNFTT